MAAAIATPLESPTYQGLQLRQHAVDSKLDDTQLEGLKYWWSTSGRDLARMLQEAGYPDEAQVRFLTFYRDVICPKLGGRPLPDSIKSGVGRDGNPFEYSFELKSSSQGQSVRFVVDVTQIRPESPAGPLSMASNQAVIDVLGHQTPGFDDAWYRFLVQRFCHSELPAGEQRAIAVQAGYQMPLILGFDIHKKVSTDHGLPVLGKCYFPPCFTAAQTGIPRWELVSSAIEELPGVHAHPNILSSLQLIQDYLAGKPTDWLEHPRYLATDFTDPSKARLKIYMRFPETAFEKIWDYYTLGGRIPGMEEDKEIIRDLYMMTSGRNLEEEDQGEATEFRRVRKKATALYFALSTDRPVPSPKINFYPSNFAKNDEVIGRGLDQWLSKYGWHVGNKPMLQRVRDVFTHRKLEEKTGIFTFVGIGRKEAADKKELSLQVYVSPELYENTRD